MCTKERAIWTNSWSVWNTNNLQLSLMFRTNVFFAYSSISFFLFWSWCQRCCYSWRFFILYFSFCYLLFKLLNFLLLFLFFFNWLWKLLVLRCLLLCFLCQSDQCEVPREILSWCLSLNFNTIPISWVEFTITYLVSGQKKGCSGFFANNSFKHLVQYVIPLSGSKRGIVSPSLEYCL